MKATVEALCIHSPGDTPHVALNKDALPTGVLIGNLELEACASVATICHAKPDFHSSDAACEGVGCRRPPLPPDFA